MQQFCFFTFPPHPIRSIEQVMSYPSFSFIFWSPGDIGHHFILAGDLLKFINFIPSSNTSESAEV